MLEKNNYQNNIKQFRVREGLTQEELAKVLKEPIERLFRL